MKSSRFFLFALLVLFLGAGGFLLWHGGRSPFGTPTQQLHLLAYVGYDEPDFISPLQKALNTKLTVDTYASGEEMYTKFTQAPRGSYDIVVLDAEYGERLFKDGRLLSLDQSLWKFDDLFSKFGSGEPARVGSDVYAAIARWGSIGIVFNTKHIDPALMTSYDILFDKKLRGRIGIYDWYLPNMGILSLSEGNQQPYNITADRLLKLEDKMMSLRPQVNSIQPSPGQVLTDFRNDTIWAAPGIGEWAAASLASEGLPIDWVVPQPGGIMWVEAFAISADSTNLELSKQFLQEVMKPQNIALLATRKAYFSQVTRRSAYDYIPATARNYLKASDLQALDAVADHLQFRHLPGPGTTEQEWIAAWAHFKAGK